MEDKEIIELYWQRNETAIKETDSKYGNYLYTVARNILNDPEDSRETVNDTYVKTWNAIPPQRPNVFLVWLSKITRSLAVDRIRFLSRKKRGSGQYETALEEIEGCIGVNASQKMYEADLLKDALNAFLRRYPEKQRNLFLCRYFYFDSLKEAAGACGFTEAAAKTSLFRMRAQLKTYLEEEGFLS